MHLLSCRRQDMHRAFATPVRSRWDYHAHDHSIEDIFNDDYFRDMIGELNPGDRILVVDRYENEAEFRVQDIDEELNKVRIALYERPVFKPSSNDYQIRHAGGRGRASRYQIVDPEGQIAVDDLVGKKSAERALDELKVEAA